MNDDEENEELRIAAVRALISALKAGVEWGGTQTLAEHEAAERAERAAIAAAERAKTTEGTEQ